MQRLLSISLSIALAVAAVGCRDPAAELPRPLSVTPDRGPVSLAVPITIRGTGFHASANTDFADPEESSLDVRFSAFLGPVALRDVHFHADGSLTATVPEGLPIGLADLRVVDPEGREGTLAGAYSVLADTDVARLVAAYRIEPIGPQTAFVPFTVTVTALDSAGEVVTAFNGAVTLGDLTGSAVPGSVGLFRSGVWTGSVEVRSPHAADVLSVADGLGNTAASNPFAVAPCPAVGIRFTTPPRTVAAGECSGPAQPLTLSLHDAFGGTTVASGDLALTVAAAAGLELFADDQCTAALAAPAVPDGTSTLTAWFRSTRAGDAPLDVAAPSLLGATQLEMVLAGPPASLSFVTTPQAVNAGACSQVATLEVRDAWGNPVDAGAPAIDLAVTASAGFELFSDAACSLPASTVTPPAGAARADFWFRGTLAEVVTVSATSLGLPGVSQDETITPEGNASRLVFLTPPRDTVAGGCSDIVTVQSQDSYGNAVSGAGAVQVALSASPAAAFAFFADDACAIPIAGGAAEIAAGRSTTGFHFLGTAAGAVRVTASSTTLTSADQLEQIQPGPPARLAFTSAPQSVTAASCSGLVSLALRDDWGNPAVAAAPVDVALAAAPAAGFALYSDPLCATPATGATVPSGGSGAGFYFKGTKAGTVTVDASAAGLAGASQAEQIRAAAPDRLAFSTAPQTVEAGGCSGVVTVELRDPNGNGATTAGATAVGLVPSPAAGFALFSDAACAVPLPPLSIPAGSSAASFFFRATVAGSVGVTASSTGLTPATQLETVLPAPADRIVFTTSAQSVSAGLCSAPVGIEARDPWGNASPLAGGATVALAASPAAGFVFHDGAGCGGAPTGSIAIAPGASGAALSFSGTVTGNVTITASSAPLAPATQVEAIVPLAPDRLAFVTAPQSVSAGACSQAAVVELRDALGNPAPAPALTAVALSSGGAAGFAFYSDAACTAPITGVDAAAGSSAVQFFFRGTAAGTVTVTASATGLSPASQAEQVLPGGSASRLVYLTPPRSITAGGCSAVVTVEQQDSYGNPVTAGAATPLTLAVLPAGALSFFADDACTVAIPPGALEIAAGSTSAGFHFGGTAAGTAQVTASAAGVTSAVQLETVVAAAPTALVFTTGAQSVKAGSCSAVAGLQLRDAYGNTALAAGDVAVALSAAPASGFAFYSDAACGSAVTALTVASGASAGSFWFRGTEARSVTVTANAASLGSAPTQVETITPAAPDHLAFATGPQTVTAGACSAAVGLVSLDALGNGSPVAANTTVSLTAAPATGVSLYAGGACAGAPVSAVTLLATTSSVTFSFRVTRAGTVTLTASAVGMTPNPSQQETIVAASPDRLAFTSGTQSLAAGACSAAATVQSQDPWGNPAAVGADTPVALSAAPATGFAFYSDSGCTVAVTAASIASGATSATFWFSGTRAGSVVVTAAVTGWTAATQTETVSAGPTSRFVWDAIASPQAQSRPFSVRLSAQDAWGNATAYVGTALLSLVVSPPVAPVPALTCASGCPAGLTTGAFSAGIWTGSVSVGGPESPIDGTPDRWLVATSGAVTGSSNAFELTGTPVRSPPLAKVVPTPALIREGQSITFDASGSSDYQTPTANLQISWDLSGTAAAPPAYPAPAAPWTAWTTTKTVSNTFSTAGTYTVHVAVRDADGDIGYAATTIEVRVLGTSACTVDTNSDVDDGASNCRPWLGNHGTDGRVSLREALRVAVDGDTINFTSAMTISGTGTYTISDRIRILGQGVILDTKSLVIDDGTVTDPVEIIGLELTGQPTTSPVTVRDGRHAILRDVYLHDAAGIADYGVLTLERVRMARCTGSCVTLYDSNDVDTLTVRYSELRGAGTGTALDVGQCAAGSTALSLQSTVLDGFQTAIRVACPGSTSVLHSTFEANGTGIEYYAGAASVGHVLRNSIFSAQATAAATCGLASFTSRDYHLLWQNASNGCLDGDPDAVTADPLYVFPAAGDFRLRMTSAAVDSAVDLGLYLLSAFPAAPGPRLLGAGADRGGRETY